MVLRVVKVSGKAITPKRPDLMKGYVSLFRKLAGEGYKLVVVVGGGDEAREFIEAGRELGLTNALLDELGIRVARLKALTLAYAVGPELAAQRVPRSVDEAVELAAYKSVVFVGGFQPGQSTNAVSLLVAEALGADLVVNACSVPAVYDKDPRKYPDAKPLKRISVAELSKVLSQEALPGRYELMDHMSMIIASRSRIAVRVVDAFDLRVVEEAIRGKDVGTLIVPE